MYGFSYYTVLSDLLNRHLLYPSGFGGSSTNYLYLHTLLNADSFTPLSCKLVELMCY